MKNQQNSTSNTSLEQQINMLSHWQIKLCESLDLAKGKELKQVLRFARWYFREQLMELVEKAVNEVKEFSDEDFYTAMYVTYESEVTECQQALDGNDKVWDARGELLPDEQLEGRIEAFEPLMKECAMQLCEECN